MPKKTRKQKLKLTQERTVKNTPELKDLDLHKSIKAYTIADLRKTVLLTFFLFALEFIIFYANLK